MTARTTADLAVVGGGIIGCFTAHQAAQAHPDWHVVLVERATIGGGATAWSAGVSFPLAATTAHRRLVRASASAYAALRETAAGRFLRPVPMVYVVGRDGRAALRDRLVDAGSRPVTPAERGRIDRMLPGVRIDPDEDVLTHDGHGFAVDAGGLAAWLVSAGVTVHCGERIDTVEAVPGGYRLGGSTTGWTAARVVLATGAWPAPGPPSAGQPVRGKRVAALHAALPTEPGDPLVYFLDDDLFFLPSAGATLVSFYRDVWDLDPASVDGRASEADLLVGTEAVRRRSPAAADAVTGGRAHCDGYAPDRLPVVSAHPGHPGLVTVRGGSGSGVRLAPALAADALLACADIVPTDRTPDPAPAGAGRR